jgi:hypothetical protein
MEKVLAYWRDSDQRDANWRDANRREAGLLFDAHHRLQQRQNLRRQEAAIRLAMAVINNVVPAYHRAHGDGAAQP